MARFNCNLPAAAARESAQVVAEALSAMEREGMEETPGGPGWFDSSRELVRGLEVTESLPGDAALNEWVRLCFAR
ncbi:MAG: hypothetical protein Q8R33_05955 [Burkholderiales bacterium]|nr:hypothetical protein [Burkholderiales bacterium]